MPPAQLGRIERQPQTIRQYLDLFILNGNGFFVALVRGDVKIDSRHAERRSVAKLGHLSAGINPPHSSAGKPQSKLNVVTSTRLEGSTDLALDPRQVLGIDPVTPHFISNGLPLGILIQRIAALRPLDLSAEHGPVPGAEVRGLLRQEQ